MNIETKSQFLLLLLILIFYGLLAFLTYTCIPIEEIIGSGQSVPEKLLTTEKWILGLQQAGMVFAIYLPLSLAGYWFTKRTGSPKIYRTGSGWRSWFMWPMIIGIGLGSILIIIDRSFRLIGSTAWLSHPVFPFSLIASATAAMGEEIIFRFFLMGLIILILKLLFKNLNSGITFWIGNILAALAFSAGHMPGTLQLLNIASLSQVPILVVLELFTICTLVGIVAGYRYYRDGLIAAIGVHFWTDIVWHVLWPFIMA
ncbi:MAG: CPBP family intramembrane metalloprotease [Bacteroidales bacterium]|nr:CPBP family intramembrane metalloprotease [Bacteroidales bacterium]